MRPHAAPSPASDCRGARRATARRDHRVTLTMAERGGGLAAVDQDRGRAAGAGCPSGAPPGRPEQQQGPRGIWRRYLRRRRASCPPGWDLRTTCEGDVLRSVTDSCCSSGSDGLLPVVAGRESTLGTTGAKKWAADHDRSWRSGRMCPCVHERREHDVSPDIGVHRSHRCT